MESLLRNRKDSQKSMEVYTKQQRIAELAKRYSYESIKSLNHYIDIEWLHEAYRRTRKGGAVGIDNATAAEYAMNLDENLQSLLDRFKSGTYTAPAVKRAYIPKDDKGEELRAIGIPTFEDKILQRAVTMVLEPIFESEYYSESYGFRLGRSAHGALDSIWKAIMSLGSCWVLEIDIRKYFDSVEHRYIRKFYEQRVCDGVITRTLGKWLKAGVMEDGAIHHYEDGTPQGGVISPLLGNIYLHEVLDKWFEKDIKPRLKGRAHLVRFADDFIILFEQQSDARRVQSVLPKRFAWYGLTIHPEKSRLLYFTPPNAENRKPETFNFLGFKHFWGKSRKGNWVVKRRTAKDRLVRSVRKIYRWCKENRHEPVKDQWKKLCAKVRGHYIYFGITFNSRCLERFLTMVKRSWRKWLDRRNRERHMNWEKFNRLLDRYPLPSPKIYHTYERIANP